jgi:chemotaxis family two-component system response regulator Rcp1
MKKEIRVLLVEDSVADANLVLEVLQEEKIAVNATVVRDGEEAMAFLGNHPPFEKAVRPDLILLDLNLPKKDGRQVLAEIKEDHSLKSTPVVVLTTSQSEEDILRSYNLQASCYVIKPIDLEQFIKIVKAIDGFWFSAVRFPSAP